MSRVTFTADRQAHPPRDSLELASLASSSSPDSAGRSSIESSRSGISSSRKLSLEADDPLSDHNTLEPGQTRHARSYSVTSAFDFGSNLFPLSQTAGGYAPLGAPSVTSLDRYTGLRDGSLEKHKSLTYLNGLSLIVGLIIGSGIFSSPSQVNTNAGSPGAALIVWAVAGLLAWTGAASYAELGGAIPLNGGPQVYLSKIFGEIVGFLFAWCAVFVLKPGSAAIIAIIFGEYVVRAFIGAEVEQINPWINKGVGLIGVLGVTLLNCASTKLGTFVGDISMFFKFVALIAVTVIGIVVAITGVSSKGQASQDWKNMSWFEGTNTNISGWAVALYAGLWAFDGWDNTNYVTGEFKNPRRDLPRAIHTAMPVVIICYLMANVAYVFVLPMSTIAKSNTVAVQFGSQVFGPVGALILALVVSGSCLGALNATVFTSGRLVYAAGKEGYLPAIFGNLGFGKKGSSITGGRLQRRSRLQRTLVRLFGDGGGIGYTPINAMIFNAIITSAYVAVGEFGTLITFYGVAGYTFYFLTVLGLIVMRIREPHLERPYKTWITTPIIFCCVSLFLLSRAVIAEPLQTLIVVAFVAAGVPAYFWRMYQRDGTIKLPDWKFWKRR
ncbi:Large neutral amino acids transporter small subunit 2 [Talaromyces islandicus]|uniref:Large neutral amino acids transporter small subunit 2 n=1 Tax=Talaromyces islandicus TaxID=28573 RepID=A0A0U1LZN1_TALIS|nr:Large neutral amino acids transporter small subunit 2 [Talaromyces islandicus]